MPSQRNSALFMSETMNADAASRTSIPQVSLSLLAIGLFAVSSLPGHAQGRFHDVAPVVVSSVSAVPAPSVINPTDVALDACGNIYTVDLGNNTTTGATLTEVPANGAAASVVENLGGFYFGHLGQDPTRSNLIVGIDYSTGANLVPLTHCVPNPSAQVKTGGGNGPLFFYYNPDFLAGDFAGNTYLSTSQTCCVPGNYYLIQEQKGNSNSGSILLANQPAEVQSIAVDKNQNVYFISAGALYELPFSGGSSGTYATTPLPYGTAYTNPVGVSVDTEGNLFIADEGAAAIYEVPNHRVRGGGTALNPADQFTVATGVTSAVPVAVDKRGDLYYTSPNATAIDKLSLGGADFGKVTRGQSETRTLKFQFNSPTTIAKIILPEGAFAAEPVSGGSVPCTAGAHYGPGSYESQCSIVVTFTPKTLGKHFGAVVLLDYTIKEPIVVAYLEGVGK